jgi:hypothetical protein
MGDVLNGFVTPFFPGVRRPVKAHVSRRRALLVAYLAVVLISSGVLVGCNRGRGKVKACYLGLTCENPIFAAYEFG